MHTRAARTLTGIALLAGVLFALYLVIQQTGRELPSPVIYAQEEKAGDLECSSYCSAVRPGTSIIEVKMRVAPQALAPAALRTRVRQQKLEVTVYSEGFERGLFTVLDSVQPKALFHPAPRSAAAAAAGAPAPRLPTALTHLVVTDIATRPDQPPREPLRLAQAMAAGAEWVVVRVEGVDPGTDYIYRVPGSSATVTCRAEVCPVDVIRAAPRTKKAAPPKPGAK